MAHVGVLSSLTLFGWHVGAHTLVKKDRSPTHPTQKVTTHLSSDTCCYLSDSSATVDLFPLPFFSLFHVSIYVQSFDKFNCVLQFVFILGLTFILLIFIFVRFIFKFVLFLISSIIV